MNMTLDQYILNPMGKNNAVLNASTREILRKTYVSKFDNILLREKGKIDYRLYYDKKNNTYWAHIKVPSEVVKDFYYDVVFKFTANESISDGGNDLFKYNVRFYSNDPAFVFTYAHVFRINDLFIKELYSKMSKEALKKPPVEKNPTKDIGYVKAIYFAYLVMENKGLNKKLKFVGEAKTLDSVGGLGYLLSQIEDADTKVQARQEEGAKVSKAKKITIDDKTYRNMKKYIGRDTDMSNSKLQVSTTKKINKITNKSTTKSTKRVGSIKKK